MFALLPLVNIVFAVAGVTLRRQFLFIEVTGVACATLDIGVFTEQRIMRLPRVIERDAVPSLGHMTGVALTAEASLVAFFIVVALMACITLARGIFVLLADVAAYASGGNMLAF